MSSQVDLTIQVLIDETNALSNNFDKFKQKLKSVSKTCQIELSAKQRKIYENEQLINEYKKTLTYLEKEKKE